MRVVYQNRVSIWISNHEAGRASKSKDEGGGMKYE